MTRSIARLLVLAVGAVLFGAACDDKKASDTPARTEAGTSPDKYATADPKLANALQPAASASAAATTGPPPEGIFAAGAADRRHPAGAPTTIDVISEGSEPRVVLASSGADASADPRANAFGRAVLETAMQLGPRSAIVIDLGLALGPAKKDEGGPDWVVAEVKRAVPGEHQMGQLPPGADKDIASLNGAMIRIKLTPDGRESDVELQLAKSVRGDFERLAMNAAEALVLATVPLPTKPMGVGAQWIAETRMPLSGLDVIAYRAYRVKEIEGDRARVTLTVKAYAASTDVKYPGVPKGATLQQFDAQSQGELEVVRGEAVARKSDLQQRVIMVFEAPAGSSGAGGQPPGAGPGGNLLTAQVQSQATLVRGDDLRSATK